MDTHPPYPTHHPGPSEQSDRPANHPTPDAPTFDDDVVAAVVGDLPVPITVWRTACPNAARPRVGGTRSVYRLICAYSRPGEAVADQADGHTLTATGHAGGRHHHPGRFTDMAGLPIGSVAGQCHG